MNMAEIGFKPLAWKMSQRNEGFSFSPAVLEQVTLYLGVAAVVTVLVAEATAHLSGGMPLFWRRRLVVSKDLVNDRKEGPQDRRGSVPHLWNRIGLEVRCRRLMNRRHFRSSSERLSGRTALSRLSYSNRSSRSRYVLCLVPG